MNRRAFLSLLSASSIAATLDPEMLLWVPGAKKIFLPPLIHRLTESQILEAELERMAPFVASLFERDSFFYKAIDEQQGDRMFIDSCAPDVDYDALIEKEISRG